MVTDITPWQRNKQLGLCGRCGKVPPPPGKSYCENCKAYYARRFDALPSEMKVKRLKNLELWKKQNPSKVKEKQARYKAKLRQEVIAHYGGKCACCGENNIAFLTIHHIDGAGNAVRRSLFGGFNSAGIRSYKWIRRTGYPDRLGVLCWNCHMAITLYHFCPHQHQDKLSNSTT